MEKVLHAAGVPQRVLGHVSNTVDTCRECRAWKKPSPDVTPSVELVTKPNTQVEVDILYYKTFLALVMVDRSDRWTATSHIENREAATLCEAMDATWLAIHSPFTCLVVDGETEIAGRETTEYLKRKGVTIHPRAPQQHARIVERMNALLRHAMHTAEEQLKRENMNVTFKQLLAECTFACNSMITHNGASPYNARVGRQPSMLPDLQAPPDDTSVGPGRYVHRIREVSLQKIIESTATARINRASRSQTTAAGEQHDYQPKELVDYHRPTLNKDESGWHGPAKVVKNLPSSGQVTIQWQG